MNTFSYKKEVDRIRTQAKRNIGKTFKVMWAVLFGYIVVSAIYEHIFQTHDSWAVFIDKVFVLAVAVAVFAAYKYFTEKPYYEAKIGTEILARFTQPLAEQYIHSYFIEDLHALNGFTYSQLNRSSRALLARAVSDKTYLYNWVFTSSELVAIANTDKLKRVEEFMLNSKKVINVKKKKIQKKYDIHYDCFY